MTGVQTCALPILAVSDEIQAGSFTLIPAQKRLVTPSDEIIKLTALESSLLFVLMNQPNRTIERSQLVRRVWGYYGIGDETLLKNLIYRLRKKIESDPYHPRVLLTDSDIGYYFHIEAPR